MKRLLSLLFLPAALPLAAEPVLVGTFPAKVVPEQISVLNLPEKGIVTDIAQEGHQAKGAVLAILDKERMEEEREDMEFALAKERISQRDELRKLRQQREKLVFYLGLTPEERKYATADVPTEGEMPTNESLRDIDERIALVQRDLDTMEKRKRTEFERKHEKQTLRMPFDGRLQYNVNLPEDRTKPYEFTGMVQNFATVCDDSSYYVTISVARSDLSLLPEDKFSVRVALPEGRELRAPFAFRRVERSGSSGGDMLAYFFRLPEADSETAYGMLGSNTKASLFYEVDGTVERVSKASLAAHPQAGQCESWAELVALAHPGAVVVVVADRDVVIRHAGQGEAKAEGDAQP